MLERIEQLTRGMERRPGAPIQELRDFFNSMDFSPAEDYLDFMKEANGAEGNVGRNAYLAIYSIQEMKTLNTGTQTLEPQLLFFGSNMGGEGYAFDLSRPGKPIVAIELDTLDRRYADDMGSSLLQFLEALDARYA